MESLSYEEFLLEVMERERETRRQHRVERASRVSKLPLEKTMKSFERKRLPRKVDAHINVLLEGTFLDLGCWRRIRLPRPRSFKLRGLQLPRGEVRPPLPER